VILEQYTWELDIPCWILGVQSVFHTHSVPPGKGSSSVWPLLLRIPRSECRVRHRWPYFVVPEVARIAGVSIFRGTDDIIHLTRRHVMQLPLLAIVIPLAQKLMRARGWLACQQFASGFCVENG